VLPEETHSWKLQVVRYLVDLAISANCNHYWENRPFDPQLAKS